MWEAIVNNPATVAAVASAIATIFAAITAWLGPRSAAELAERLRRDSEARIEHRRMKMWVFTALMQERAAINSSDAVKALNLIDVVYKDCNSVREAWAELLIALNPEKGVFQLREEKLRMLLREMAAELQLADRLRSDDFGRVYYPNSLAEEEQWRTLERQAALQRLVPQPVVSAASSPAAPQTVAIQFPPKPSDVKG